MEDIINEEAKRVNSKESANDIDDKLVDDKSVSNPSLDKNSNGGTAIEEEQKANEKRNANDKEDPNKTGDNSNDTDHDGEEDSDSTKENDSSEDSIIADLIARSGYDILDDDGNPIEFEDTEEGILEFSNKLAEVKAREQVESFISKNQEVLDFYNYLQAGGTKENYFKNDTSFLDIEIQKEDITTQERIITKDLTERGFSDARIKSMIKSLKDNDTLFQEAISSKKDLIKNYESQQNLRKEETEKALEAKRAKIAEHWNQVNAIVSKGEFNNGFIVPEKERGKFFDYISKPINDENTSASMVAYRELPLEEKLTIDYLVMKAREQNLSIVDYISQRQETKKAKSLKDRLSKRSGVSSGKNGVRTESTNSSTKYEKSSNIENFGVEDLVIK